MRGVVPAAMVAGFVLILAACTQEISQQTVSPPATPSTAAVTPSTAPTPADSPTPTGSPPAIASPSPAKLIIKAFTFHLGEVGVTYGTVTVVAAGGVKPYKWSISGGVLPPGVALSSGGKATGKPTANGSFSFVVRVDDSAGSAAGAPGSILVFRQIAFTSLRGTCSGTYLTGCTTQLKYTGGASSAPKVIVTQDLALWPPLPPGSTFTAKAGFVNVSIPPVCTLGNGTAVVTVVLVDQSPCGAGFNCSSAKLTLTINLPGAC
jgi:hypothetical protein